MAAKIDTPFKPRRTPPTIDQFANRVSASYQGVEHGDDPTRAAEVVRRSWRSLDPIDTVRGPDAVSRSSRLSIALGKAATVVDQANKRRAPWGKGLYQSLLLDQAVADFRTRPTSTAVENLETILKGDIRSRKGENRIEHMFETLSARAMLLHTESQKLSVSGIEAQRRQNVETILKASLGHLIKDSVNSTGELHRDYILARNGRRDGSHISGRLVEMMYFTYRLMHSYRNEGSLTSNFPRFALQREDMPLITTNPRRSFDVAVSGDTSGDTELVQVKAWRAQQQYAEGITVWRPNQRGIVDETESVMDWFNVIVDNETSCAQMNIAWQNLTNRFGMVDQPT